MGAASLTEVVGHLVRAGSLTQVVSDSFTEVVLVIQSEQHHLLKLLVIQSEQLHY